MILVIVESPAKAKTIEKYLGKDYKVESSIGHIRDLPSKKEEIPAQYVQYSWAKTGIDVDNGYKPLYIVNPQKTTHVARLRELAKKASQVILATDDDREGEAISWHLKEELNLRPGSYKRVVFHEITKAGIEAGMRAPRDIDMDLVKAQEGRRVVDRLFGYGVSPKLWNMVDRGLSAGRVQSVATRLVVERERARMRFTPAQYSKLEAHFEKAGVSFKANLASLGGVRLSSGKDYDPDSGTLKADLKTPVLELTPDIAREIAAELRGAQANVRTAEQKPVSRKPPEPFVTLTMAQEAARRFGWPTAKTTQVAQKLYDSGSVTYIRTDSPTLSEEATEAARQAVARLYPNALPADARVYKSKDKSAQEAHEAIRPAGTSFKTPQEMTGLDEDMRKLYTLIYERTLASQMKDSQGLRTQLTIVAPTSRGEAAFTASGTVITDPGFLALYEEGEDEEDDGKKSKAGSKNEEEVKLPEVREGEQLEVQRASSSTSQTKAPPRYSESSLLTKLKDAAIGRPSTYASIMGTIQARGYILGRNNMKELIPTWNALATTEALEQHLPTLIDYDFTAKLEAQLDQVARGQISQTQVLDEFYRGENGLKPVLERVTGKDSPQIDLPGTGAKAIVRPDGVYLFTQDRHATVDRNKVLPADITAQLAKELLKNGTEGELPSKPRGQGERAEPQIIGDHPKTGQSMTLKSGRFGPYISMGEGETERRASVPAGEEKMLTPERAAVLLDLNRVIGMDGKEEIRTGLGKYGPYIRKGKEYRSITQEEASTMSLEEAKARFAQVKKTLPKATQQQEQAKNRRPGPRRGNS